MPRLDYDYTNLTADVVGADHGISDADIDALRPALAAAVDDLHEFGAGEDRVFLDLPDVDPTPLLDRAREDAERFTDLVVLGIGGSSLGARAVYSALTRPYTGDHRDGSTRDGVRLHFVENVDAVATMDLLDHLDLRTTAFNVVTKSGNTIETMSTFAIIRERLIDRFGFDGYQQRVIATTDPRRGGLRQIVEADGLTSFDVPPGVGGRFSVLTPVGLYPLAAAGLDIEALLHGARRARTRAGERAAEENPAGLFALAQVAFHERAMRDVVLMPYAVGLADTAAWFVQLWAESLGKKRRAEDGTIEHVGPTPIGAIGVTDQHSQLQLYMEGPPTKNLVFVEVGTTEVASTVPSLGDACSSLRHLSGRSLDEIMLAELRGVRAGLAEVGRPTSTFRMDVLDADTLGQLLMTLECATALAGHMLGVDPYDQPGVELGKRYAHGLLGRDKERAYAEQLREGMANRTARVVRG